MDKPSSKTPLTNPSKYFGNELDYLAKVLNSESWSATGGSWTQTLEQNFSKKFGRHYGIAFNSGTSTLHAALEAVGVGSGDEVISPALTVIMDTTATLHANAIPVYADVDPDTFNIDPVDLARRTTFLKLQRKKLLALKRTEREKQLVEAEASHGKTRPKSAIAARSALSRLWQRSWDEEENLI